MNAAALLLGLLASAAGAKKPRAVAVPGLEASRFFASRPGLVRIYEGRAAHSGDDTPPAGASCEVLESRGPTMRESCTMIVARKVRPATELTYEVRPAGIYAVQARQEGSDKSQPMERLVLPSPLRIGATWKEGRPDALLTRSVKTAGRACKAAGRTFADCLVVAVTQSKGRKVTRKYSETYAAGVGLVEDAQWALVDIKGL